MSVTATAASAGAAAGVLTRRMAVAMFVAFAFAYFFSALLRAVTATLAPVFSAELGLGAAQLGLLAGAYFFGFASTQLPLGSALDRFGPRRVLMALLAVAVLGCVGFATARGFGTLALARALIGVGVSACLMAPLTAYRAHFDAVDQLRANAWMLMAGSIGMVASTLPVQWLLPLLGWRGLFWAIAALVAVAMAGIAWYVPRDARSAGPAEPARGDRRAADAPGYAAVFRHPTFVRFAPIALFPYAGMVAVQTLWAGPWLVQVCEWSPGAAARGLFGINVAMLLAFLAWGLAVPRLHSRGWTAQRVVVWGMPISLAALTLALWLGRDTGAWCWGLYCVSSTFVSMSQPAVGQAFPRELAGRALSAFNLLIFAGVFVLQWGIGLVIDALRASGQDTLSAFRGAFALLALCCLASYLWFLCRDDAVRPPRTDSAT